MAAGGNQSTSARTADMPVAMSDSGASTDTAHSYNTALRLSIVFSFITTRPPATTKGEVWGDSVDTHNTRVPNKALTITAGPPIVDLPKES